MPDTVIAFIDGASRGNPGKAAYGVLLCSPDGIELARLVQYLGHQTNNYAEYRGLIAALQWARDNGVEHLRVRSDSELLVRQMQGTYRVKSASLRPLFQEARVLADGLRRFEIRHVGRERNREADALASEVLDSL